MVQCFAPDCNHQSETRDCKGFFRFPSNVVVREQWIKLIGREDKEPNRNSRICSCHFLDGKKENGPKIFRRNCDKLSAQAYAPRQKRMKLWPLPNYPSKCGSSGNTDMQSQIATGPQIDTETLILPPAASSPQKESEHSKDTNEYAFFRFSAEGQSDDTICMETGLPNKRMFSILVKYIERFADSIIYYNNCRATGITLEDQVLMTLMKIRQDYPGHHLSELFHCSTTTVSSIVITFIHVLHRLLYLDMLGCGLSKGKNKSPLPVSSTLLDNCKMIIDCVDIEIACSPLMSNEELERESCACRGTDYFKVLIGLAPNSAITFVSGLFPGTTSKKTVLEDCGVLPHLAGGDLILADKGFLTQRVAPRGVSIKPPSLTHEKLTESEVKLTKGLARCSMRRADAHLSDFKILRCIPAYLRCHAEQLVKVCCALINLQYSPKKACEERVIYD